MKNSEKYIPHGAVVEWHGSVAAFLIPVQELLSRVGECSQSAQLKVITATDERLERGCFRIWYVFGIPGENFFVAPTIELRDTASFPSITSVIPCAVNYERKIQTFFGLVPEGNPDQRPIILHENWPTDIFPLRKDVDWHMRPDTAHGTYEFQHVDGDGMYEIPVGPIHAGIIEPGHFRFSVAGEEIMLLEGRLGYVHKGIEKLFEVKSLSEQVHLSEKISGDSSFSHSLAYCQAVEILAGVEVPKRALYLRVIFAECERLANHLGDIAFIMLDTGYNFGGAQGQRLREMVMQINERLTGSRFLRGVNVIGGVTKDISREEQEVLAKDFSALLKDFSEVIAIAENSTSLANRLKDTGILSREIAEMCGVVGVAARAVGIVQDARIDFPYAAYAELGFSKIASAHTGDVVARFSVRIQEVHTSIECILRALVTLPDGEFAYSPSGTLKKNSLAMSIVEGWRGEIAYFVQTDSYGKITRVAPRDPSFLNWPAVGHAGFGNMVPDFPLINKSFNLSYTGNDL